jgi:hypothetical protein
MHREPQEKEEKAIMREDEEEGLGEEDMRSRKRELTLK